VEQQLSSGLGEGQIAELVEDEEVEARQIIGEPALAASSTFSLEPVDKIDRGQEATAEILCTGCKPPDNLRRTRKMERGAYYYRAVDYSKKVQQSPQPRPSICSCITAPSS
jgi:hypothetical protein